MHLDRKSQLLEEHKFTTFCTMNQLKSSYMSNLTLTTVKCVGSGSWLKAMLCYIVWWCSCTPAYTPYFLLISLLPHFQSLCLKNCFSESNQGIATFCRCLELSPDYETFTQYFQCRTAQGVHSSTGMLVVNITLVEC